MHETEKGCRVTSDCGERVTIVRMIRPVTIAVHLIFSGYGTWLPNDPRGSGSDEVRKLELDDLGPIHFGRKAEQPSRDELRAFHRGRVGYVRKNPIREGLPGQQWPFVIPYDGWPEHRRKRDGG